MWGPNNLIYFISDRDGRMNLFSQEIGSKEAKQLTQFKDFDIKFPSLGKDAIVFENAGYIWRFDLASGQATPVPIEIKEDLASGRGALVDASKHIQGVSTAPDGQRVVVVARGDIFSVPAKDGSPRNLTRTSNAHERDAVWSPDGKWIAYNSDATGENELYVRSQDGKGEPTQLTKGADTYYYAMVWSPDSKKLLWSDRLQRLRFIDVATKAVTQVDQDKTGEIESYDWSPDSQWITWARPEESGVSKVYLYSLGEKKPIAVTDDWYSSSRSVFSDDGKFLLFASARDFKPIFGQAEFSEVYRNMERIYLLPLAKETENPLGPRSDEVGKKKDKDKSERRRRRARVLRNRGHRPRLRRQLQHRLRSKWISMECGSASSESKLQPANTATSGWWKERSSTSAGPWPMKRRRMTAMAEADNRKFHLCVYNVEDRKETVLGDVNQLRDHASTGRRCW